jgi:hypothetical protein
VTKAQSDAARMRKKTNFFHVAQVLPNTKVFRDTAAWPGTAYQTIYTHSGLSCNNLFYFRVRAYKGQASSANSGVAYANTSNADSDGDGVSCVALSATSAQ